MTLDEIRGVIKSLILSAETAAKTYENTRDGDVALGKICAYNTALHLLDDMEGSHVL